MRFFSWVSYICIYFELATCLFSVLTTCIFDVIKLGFCSVTVISSCELTTCLFWLCGYLSVQWIMFSMCSWNGTMETWVQYSHSFRGGGPHCFLRSQADEGRRLTGGQTLRVVTALSVVLSGHHYPANPIRTLNPCRISIIIFRLGKAQVRSFFLILLSHRCIY